MEKKYLVIWHVAKYVEGKCVDQREVEEHIYADSAPEAIHKSKVRTIDCELCFNVKCTIDEYCIIVKDHSTNETVKYFDFIAEEI